MQTKGQGQAPGQSQGEPERKSGLNWLQVAAGALAAVTSAVLLSTLGVAGTVIGAAVGSIAASVGTHVYSRGLRVSREQVATQAMALRRVARAREDLERVAAHPDDDPEPGLEDADRELGRLEGQLEGELSRQDRVPLLSRLPWARMGLVAAGLFLAAMVAITGFELIAGRAVSTLTGGSDPGTGSTVPGIRGDRTGPSDPEPTGTRTENPTPGSTPTDEPTPDPTDGPTGSPTPTPTTSPTGTGTPTPAPSPTVTPEPTTAPSP